MLGKCINHRGHRGHREEHQHSTLLVSPFSVSSVSSVIRLPSEERCEPLRVSGLVPSDHGQTSCPRLVRERVHVFVVPFSVIVTVAVAVPS